MKVLRLADLVAIPWKNGGGTTREYAVFPEGAGMADFAWRVSRALVASDGAFSQFPGIDRTLTVVDGAAIDLVFADRTVRLDRASAPFPFPGDVPAEGRIPGAPIEDLNVMTRRGLWRHAVVRHGLDGPIAIRSDDDHTMIVALDAVDVVVDGTAVRLAAGDAVTLDRAATIAITPADAEADILAVHLNRAART